MAQKTTPPPAKTTARAASAKAEPAPVHFIFDKGNYRLLIISALIVAFGFFLMAGTTDIYSTTKIVIAPLVVLGGFAVGFIAIFKNLKLRHEHYTSYNPGNY